MEVVRSHSLISALLADIPSAIMICDDEKHIIYVNAHFTTITGYSEQEVLGLKPSILKSGLHSADFYRNMYSIIDTCGYFEGIINNRTKDGHVYPQLTSIRKLAHEGQTYYISTLVNASIDLTQEHSLLKDPLTGLPNRATLNSTIHNYANIAKINNQSLGVLVIDLDRFKVINDNLGHDIGDKFLCQIAARFKSVLRSNDFLCRTGGDEFLLLTCCDRVQHQLMAEKMLNALKEPIDIEGYKLNASCSIGISMFPNDNDNIDTVMKNADVAMYSAKNMGKNCFTFWEDTEVSTTDSLLIMENYLRHCIQTNDIRMVYQPQLDLTTGKVCGVEALCRVGSDEFQTQAIITLAEDTHLIIPLGEKIMELCVAQAAEWDLDIPICVNISQTQLKYGNVDVTLTNLLDKYNVKRKKIQIEFTESQHFDESTKAMAAIKAMSLAGTRLILDDFGVGYANIVNIYSMSVSKLKLDKCFIDFIGTSGEYLTEALLRFGNSLELKIIAEGVTTEAQVNWLKERKCDAIQGYYFSKPMVPAKLLALYRKLNILG